MNIHITKEFIEKLPKAFMNNIVLFYETPTRAHNIARLCKNLSSIEIHLEGITVNNYSPPTLIIYL